MRTIFIGGMAGVRSLGQNTPPAPSTRVPGEVPPIPEKLYTEIQKDTARNKSIEEWSTQIRGKVRNAKEGGFNEKDQIPNSVFGTVRALNDYAQRVRPGDDTFADDVIAKARKTDDSLKRRIDSWIPPVMEQAKREVAQKIAQEQEQRRAQAEKNRVATEKKKPQEQAKAPAGKTMPTYKPVATPGSKAQETEESRKAQEQIQQWSSPIPVENLPKPEERAEEPAPVETPPSTPPPVTTPPVKAPPVATPPVKAPPVATPPPQKVSTNTPPPPKSSSTVPIQERPSVATTDWRTEGCPPGERRLVRGTPCLTPSQIAQGLARLQAQGQQGTQNYAGPAPTTPSAPPVPSGPPVLPPVATLALKVMGVRVQPLWKGKF